MRMRRIYPIRDFRIGTPGLRFWHREICILLFVLKYGHWKICSGSAFGRFSFGLACWVWFCLDAGSFDGTWSIVHGYGSRLAFLEKRGACL